LRIRNARRTFSPREFCPREDFSATLEKSDRADKILRAEKKLGISEGNLTVWGVKNRAVPYTNFFKSILIGLYL
jgi:hypothetical protein